MRKIINGEPHIIRHECLPGQKGRRMTDAELHEFAVKTLKEEYEMSSNTVFYPSNELKDTVDLCLSRIGTTINIKVVYSDSLDIDMSQVDISEMIYRFYKFGEIPRITVASAWCFDSENGKPELCGGSFCFKYYSFSLIPDEVNRPLPEVLSPLGLAAKYAEAWAKLSADIIEPYLDKDFHYHSDWVFDEMPSRYEYMDYFRGKLHTISKNPNIRTVKATYSKATDQAGVILRQGNNDPVIILLGTRNGRILSASMKGFIPGPSDEV